MPVPGRMLEDPNRLESGSEARGAPAVVEFAESAAATALGGRIDGRGNSGLPLGKWYGAQPTPEGPTTTVTGFPPDVSVVVVVIVPETVLYCGNICGTKVSVTTSEPTVPVIMLAREGRGRVIALVLLVEGLSDPIMEDRQEPPLPLVVMEMLFTPLIGCDELVKKEGVIVGSLIEGVATVSRHEVGRDAVDPFRLAESWTADIDAEETDAPPDEASAEGKGFAG